MIIARKLLALLFLCTVCSICGCSEERDDEQSQENYHSPVNYIEIFEEMPNVPTSGNLGLRIDPHPQYIQGVFCPGEKMFLGLAINKENSANISFDKFTFTNTTTGKEQEIPGTEKLDEYSPGQLCLIGFNDPWTVPEQPGSYEVRIYLDGEIVASALFEVKEK